MRSHFRNRLRRGYRGDRESAPAWRGTEPESRDAALGRPAAMDACRSFARDFLGPSAVLDRSGAVLSEPGLPFQNAVAPPGNRFLLHDRPENRIRRADTGPIADRIHVAGAVDPRAARRDFYRTRRLAVRIDIPWLFPGWRGSSIPASSQASGSPRMPIPRCWRCTWSR